MLRADILGGHDVWRAGDSVGGKWLVSLEQLFGLSQVVAHFGTHFLPAEGQAGVGVVWPEQGLSEPGVYSSSLQSAGAPWPGPQGL